MSTTAKGSNVPVKTLDEVVIRFAGDSGDGMQITGGQFTNTSALAGNDLATFPDFPAEIRAPAGTLPGVSGFQVRFSSYDIHSPGDTPHVLVAMNPAALKVNLPDLRPDTIVIVNTGNFGKTDLKKANYDYDPLESDDLAGFRTILVDLNKLTREALKETDLDSKAQLRCKNFFALGMTYWIFSRDLEPTTNWLHKKFARKPAIADANVKAMNAGFNYCDITGVFQERYDVPPATDLPKGTYRNIMGNQATSLGLLAGANLAGLPLFLGSYPITPASDILHQLSAYKNYGVVTFQAEDEIAAIASAVGAAFAGNLAVTTTSGPGLALKGEALGLAIMAELPLVVINVQRGGPSTGLPTKTEQADLLQAMYGRNGECPCVVIAAQSPGDCFFAALEACRIALEHMVPVMLLTDGYLANGAEPWRLPDLDTLKPINFKFHTDREEFMPYSRDERLVRPWAIPGTEGTEHRIGGLEKQNITGNVSYDPQNHEDMCRVRAKKVALVADTIPDQKVIGAQEGELLLLSWGGTYGCIAGPISRAGDKSVGWVHLRHLNPMPKNLGDILKRFKKVVVPELNLGQMVKIIRSDYNVPAEAFNKIQGRPFTTDEIEDLINSKLES